MPLLRTNRIKNKKLGQSSFPLHSWLRTQSLRMSKLQTPVKVILCLFSGEGQLSIKMWLDNELKQCWWEWKIAKHGMWYQAQHFVTCCIKCEHLKGKSQWRKMYMDMQEVTSKASNGRMASFSELFSAQTQYFMLPMSIYICLLGGCTYWWNLN